MTEQLNEYILTPAECGEVWKFQREEKSKADNRTDWSSPFYPSMRTVEFEHPAGFLAYREGVREVEPKDLYKWIIRDSYNWSSLRNIVPLPDLRWGVVIYGAWNNFADTICRTLIKFNNNIVFTVNLPEKPLMPLKVEDFRSYNEEPPRHRPWMSVYSSQQLEDPLTSTVAKLFSNNFWQLAMVLQEPRQTLKDRVIYFLCDEQEKSYPRADYILVEGPVDFNGEELITKPKEEVYFVPPIVVVEQGKLRFLYGGYLKTDEI